MPMSLSLPRISAGLRRGMQAHATAGQAPAATASTRAPPSAVAFSSSARRRARTSPPSSAADAPTSGTNSQTTTSASPDAPPRPNISTKSTHYQSATHHESAARPTYGMRKRSLLRPPASMPASHAAAGTPVPRNVLELIRRYPRHPLLGFFSYDMRKLPADVVAAIEGGDAADTATAKKPGGGGGSGKRNVEVAVPVSLSLADVTADRRSRSWLAPELRAKSSFELHQLWYVLLLERNKLATSFDEVKRVGARELAIMSSLNLGFRTRKLRKSMARIKFVLNERRLALMDAQSRARAASPDAQAADGAGTAAESGAGEAAVGSDAPPTTRAEQEWDPTSFDGVDEVGGSERPSKRDGSGGGPGAGAAGKAA